MRELFAKLKEIFVKLISTPLVIKQKLKINSLNLKIETLENTIKNELYKEFMNNLDKSARLEKLTKENKRLKERNKALKEILKEN